MYIRVGDGIRSQIGEKSDDISRFYSPQNTYKKLEF
jgi:hypothetical protein